MSDNERFRCEDCRHPQGPPGHSRCEECGGLIREWAPMKPPVYQVVVGGFGPLWFHEDDYSGAYQHATGCRIGDLEEDHQDEAEITLVDFDGETEVPVADV